MHNCFDHYRLAGMHDKKKVVYLQKLYKINEYCGYNT